MKKNNLNTKILKLQMDMLWKKQRFQKLLKDKISYVLEHGDVMIDIQEIRKYLNKSNTKDKNG